MSDLIQGQVANVIDYETVLLNITFQGMDNTNAYRGRELIRIANVLTLNLDEEIENPLQKRLEERLGGKEIICHVITRDPAGKLVANIELL